MNRKYEGLEIAIIGMSAQLPDSDNYRSFWQNLVDGKEMVKRFTREELLLRGMMEKEIDHELFVNTEGVVNNKDCFDHSFFDYTAEEAALMDPQIRLMHENCWRALEDAGYTSAIDSIKIGLFAGAADNETWRAYLYSIADNLSVDPLFKTNISRSGFMCTLVSHKLNLRGPSIFVDTACSTSLTAIHLACRSLLMKECSLALAGGVTITTHLDKGYIYQQGGIKTKDGHTRTFDAQATGTGGGEGIGMVVLKRVNEAIKDGDHIYAIIKATAANNDGSNKVGYTAPSVKGQADCIKMAHQLAGIEPESISYIEAHGTATRLGDVVEVSALNQAFVKNKQAHSCAVGSVKTNIGHLDRAAGIAGVIKTALSLYYKKIPASLFFKEPNPEINFAGGPFYVNAELTNWVPKHNQPLRAGVSSFGIGGTNIHAVIEEAPCEEQEGKERGIKLLILSARTENALTRYINELQSFVSQHPKINTGDLAYTLQTGRKHFEYRKAVEFSDKEELLSLLQSDRIKENIVKSKLRGVSPVFMFSGLGTQYQGMCKELYGQEALFKTGMDVCFEAIERITAVDIRALFNASFSEVEDDLLFRIDIGQYLVFAIEYALAKLLMHWGIKPSAMIGYSFGEYVAACIAGVFSVEEAIKIIYKRGELIKTLPLGGLLSVPLSVKELEPLISDNLSVAIDNGSSCVVSGEEDVLLAFERKMMQSRLFCMRLKSAHALHSHLMEPIMQAFEEYLATIPLQAPTIPYISNVTGDWIKINEPVNPSYWCKHLRNTVQFSKGVERLVEKDKLIYIEIGPGNEISTLVNRYLEAKSDDTRAINMVRPGSSKISDDKYLLNKLGKLWCMGVAIDWTNYYASEKRKKLSLPTYSFEPTRFVAEVNPFANLPSILSIKEEQKNEKLSDWFYQVVWKQSSWLPDKEVVYKNKTVLIFADDEACLAEPLKKYFSTYTANIIFIVKGDSYEKKNEQFYIINPSSEKDSELVFADLYAMGKAPDYIFHCWSFDEAEDKGYAYHHAIGYESLLAITRGFNTLFAYHDLQMVVIGNGWYSLSGNETIMAAKATVLGAMKVISQELPHILCRAIEITDAVPSSIATLCRELSYIGNDTEIALRGKKRYVKEFEKIKFDVPKQFTAFKIKGTYIITGATGGMGQTFSKYLAENFQANLILIGRSNEPTDLLEFIQSKNAQATYVQSDIANLEKITLAIQLAEEKFGPVNGIIHTAGLADVAGLIMRRTKEDDDKVLSPKIKGTQVLQEIFQTRSLDFFIHCSSLAASIGPVGHCAYTAANLYQDALAESAQVNYPVISIQWTNLNEVGMNVKAVNHLPSAKREEIFKYGISPAEAVQVVIMSLYLNIPNPVICTTDVNKMIKEINRTVIETEAHLNNTNAAQSIKKERPDLSNNYLPPFTQMECRLAELFENYFGIKKIGVEDDFFELGGDSLKAMVLLRRMAKEFNIDISLKEFLTTRNIQGIAASMEEKLWMNKKSERKYSSEV